LEHILYGDAKAGLIQFAAVRKNPIDPVLSKVRVELESDPTKAGEGELLVVEQTLKIVMEGEREVVPRNLGGLRIPPAPTAENRKEFRVQLTRNNVPVPNHPFQLTNDYIDATGGHDHVTPRRNRNRDNYGYFIVKRTNDITDSPYSGQTQADGRETFNFVSSFFGDRMLFRVQSTQNALLWDTVSIVENVAGLIPLPSGTNNLITHTSTKGQHSLANSNYGQRDVVASVLRVVRSYAGEYGMASDIFLAVVNMSLPSGGLFDINGNWSPPHNLHRVGKSVDFSHFYRDASGTTISVNVYVDGQLIETTNAIDEGLLDKRFDLLDFDRKERLIGLIHYESRK
jgi:hypothetical protein